MNDYGSRFETVEPTFLTVPVTADAEAAAEEPFDELAGGEVSDETALPSDDPVDETVLPSEDPVDETALPTDDPVDETVLPSDDPVDETVLPSEDPVDETALPTDDPVDETVFPSDDPADDTVLPSDDVVEDTVFEPEDRVLDSVLPVCCAVVLTVLTTLWTVERPLLTVDPAELGNLGPVFPAAADVDGPCAGLVAPPLDAEPGAGPGPDPTRAWRSVEVVRDRLVRAGNAVDPTAPARPVARAALARCDAEGVDPLRTAARFAVGATTAGVRRACPAPASAADDRAPCACERDDRGGDGGAAERRSCACRIGHRCGGLN